MSTHRLPLRAALLAVALFSSACAHRGTSQEAPPQADVVTIAPAAEAGGVDTSDVDATVTDSATTIVATAESAAPSVGAAPAEGEAGPGATAPTEAEQDYAAIYGTEPPETTDPGSYDPIADPTLPEPAALPISYDPWEKYNRRMHRFNDAVDRRVAKPLAKAYVKAVPRPVRLGVGNFFNNLGQPVSALNALLQGKPKQAGQSMGRFLLNSTLGIGGLFDPATSAKIPYRSEDFGQTLGVWGWKKSRYVELPLFGPRTIRDVIGMAGDAPLSPIRPIEEDKLRVFLQGLQLVDVRVQLLGVDRMREGATDDYALVRDAWLQRRNYQIFGDRSETEDESLPEYLREEINPTVPIDAMPTPDAP